MLKWIIRYFNFLHLKLASSNNHGGYKMDVQTVGFVLLCSIVADVFSGCSGMNISVRQSTCNFYNYYTINPGEEIVITYNITRELNLTGSCHLTFAAASKGLNICAHFGPYGTNESFWGAIYTCRDKLRYYEWGKEGVNCNWFKYDPRCTTERVVYAVYNFNVISEYYFPIRIRLTARRIDTTTSTTKRNNYDTIDKFNDDDEPEEGPRYIYGLKVAGIIVGVIFVLCIGIHYCRKKYYDNKNTPESGEEVGAPSTVPQTYDHIESQTVSQQLTTFLGQDDEDNDADDYDAESGYIGPPPSYDATSPSQSTSQPQSMYTDDAPSYAEVMANKSKYAYNGSSDYQGSSGATAPLPTVNQPIPLDEPGAHAFNVEETIPTVPPLDLSDILSWGVGEIRQ